MKMNKIINLLSRNKSENNIEVYGWVKTFRANRFIAINDGSTILNLQCVIDFEKTDKSVLKRITTGAAIKVIGDLIESQGSGQKFEVKVNHILIIGDSDPDLYPIQPKKHSLEFLREKAHLRIRTTTFNAVMRIRSVLSFAVHDFFQKKNFFYINTPIITGSDAEGAGEMFKVTTQNYNTNNDVKEDFFGKETHLTVSGQLEAESYAMGLGNVYTFGPTFRAENSNTTRHLAEFWMIEPEMAFFNLNDNMDLAEEFIKAVLEKLTLKCEDDLLFLNNRYLNEQKNKPSNQRSEMDLIEKINFVVKNSFKRISYTEAISILKNSKPNKKNKFKYKINEWGVDLQSEHERFLVEKHFKCPVIIYDYPTKIKAFYMRVNDDNKTVRAMDVLFPGIGEIVGGSQREERLEVLKKRMKELHVDENELWWYLDLRRFGSVPHSGFGLGFERLVQFSTGMSNIRDVIPFPRTPQNASF
ncbi:MAG: asparagine--tRNA ligase [Flavobacteriaceae bacterium]|nr:asparagine--tRNA ligase [Flavobacteriaceae bacterium]